MRGERRVSLACSWSGDPDVVRQRFVAAVRAQMHWYQRLAAGCRRKASDEDDPAVRRWWCERGRADVQGARREREVLRWLGARLP